DEPLSCLLPRCPRPGGDPDQALGESLSLQEDGPEEEALQGKGHQPAQLGGSACHRAADRQQDREDQRGGGLAQKEAGDLLHAALEEGVAASGDRRGDECDWREGQEQEQEYLGEDHPDREGAEQEEGPELSEEDEERQAQPPELTALLHRVGGGLV